MNPKFGALFREHRKNAGKTLGDVARFLEISVSYVSEVERAQRMPWSNDVIRAVAEFFNVPAGPLLAAAGEVRGAFQLPSENVTELHNKVGASLERRWADLTPEDLELLEREVLSKYRKNNEE